jgi:hypothetical protein
MAQLLQLHEVVAEALGGICEDEIAAQFTVVKDWAGRLCVTAEDAAKALALAPRMKAVPYGETVRWERES